MSLRAAVLVPVVLAASSASAQSFGFTNPGPALTANVGIAFGLGSIVTSIGNGVSMGVGGHVSWGWTITGGVFGLGAIILGAVTASEASRGAAADEDRLTGTGVATLAVGAMATTMAIIARVTAEPAPVALVPWIHDGGGGLGLAITGL